jgi:hypothetical protein
MTKPILTDAYEIKFIAESAASQPAVTRAWMRYGAPLTVAAGGALCAFGAPHPIVFGCFAVAIALVHLQWRRRFERALDVTALAQFDIPPPSEELRSVIGLLAARLRVGADSIDFEAGRLDRAKAQIRRMIEGPAAPPMIFAGLGVAVVAIVARIASAG